MRSLLLLLLAALTLPLTAEKVTFDTDDRFSLEFPDTWVKAKTDRSEALVYREHKNGEASFTVTRLAIPADRRANLQATLQTLVTSFKKAGMTVVGDVKGQEGEIDGKNSMFGIVPAKIKNEDTVIDLTFFLVLVEASDRIVILQAALPAKASNDLRGDCRQIIGSFHEKGPEEVKKPATDKKDKKDGE